MCQSYWGFVLSSVKYLAVKTQTAYLVVYLLLKINFNHFNKSNNNVQINKL